jgi:hypothetical protein
LAAASAGSIKKLNDVHAYGNPGFFVYEWDNTVTNSGYDDYHDGGLDNLMRDAPGISNPNTRQAWCVAP